MRTEQEIRSWRLAERTDTAHRDVPQYQNAREAVIATLNWVLDDTPQADLIRIRGLAEAKIGDAVVEWLQTPNAALMADATPLQYIAAGMADALFPAIDAL